MPLTFYGVMMVCNFFLTKRISCQYFFPFKTMKKTGISLISQIGFTQPIEELANHNNYFPDSFSDNYCKLMLKFKIGR
jgi:hypothetical protein